MQINKEMEEARIKEKTSLNSLQNNLYEMQRKMQNLQQELEKVSYFSFNNFRSQKRILPLNKTLKTKLTRKTRIRRK